MKLRLKTNSRDFTSATRGSSKHCILARCLDRMYPGLDSNSASLMEDGNIFFDYERVSYMKDGKQQKFAECSLEMNNYINNFDSGVFQDGASAEAEFELELTELGEKVYTDWLMAQAVAEINTNLVPAEVWEQPAVAIDNQPTLV